MNLGILCSSESPELAATIAAAAAAPAAIKIVIADRDSAALTLARAAGLYGVFVPRAAYHANRDGFERRLVEMFAQAEARLVILAGYQRETGPVLAEAFPLLGQGLGPAQLARDLPGQIRDHTFSLAKRPCPAKDAPA